MSGDAGTARHHAEAVAPWQFGEEGEDLVQEARARALARGVSCDAVPWLRVVAKRIAVDRARRRREIPSGAPGDLELLARDLGAGPEEELLADEDRTAVRRALDELPPRYRDALVAYSEEGSASAVASKLSLSPGATWTLLCRARSRLRHELERAGFVPAAVILRIQRWQGPVATGALALCIAVTLAVQAPESGHASQPPAGLAAPRVTIAGDSVAALSVTSQAASIDAQGSVSPPARSTAVAPVAPEVPVRYEAGTCAPEAAGGRPFLVRVRFEDDERPSMSEAVVEAIPEPLREVDAGGCEQ